MSHWMPTMDWDTAVSQRLKVENTAAETRSVSPVEILETSGGFSFAISIGMRVMQKKTCVAANT